MTFIPHKVLLEQRFKKDSLKVEIIYSKYLHMIKANLKHFKIKRSGNKLLWIFKLKAQWISKKNNIINFPFCE